MDGERIGMRESRVCMSVMRSNLESAGLRIEHTRWGQLNVKLKYMGFTQ